MNPEAVAWLESLSQDARIDIFQPPIGRPGELFSIKYDHETSNTEAGCSYCNFGRGLIVVGW